MNKLRFSFDTESLLYLASGLCIALALGILITPAGKQTPQRLQSSLIDAKHIDAIAPEKAPDIPPGRVSPPMQWEAGTTPAEEKGAEEYLQIGRQELAKKNGRGALDALLRAEEKGGTSTDLTVSIAEARTLLRDFDQAEKTLRDLLSREPGNSKAQLALARVLLHQAGNKEQDTLLDEAMTLLTALPAVEEAHFLSCLISTYKNSPELQKDTCARAKEGTSTNARIAADILAQRDLFATFRDGNRSYIDLLYAKSMADAGYYDLSSIMAKRIVEANREYRDAWVVLGYAYLVMEKYSLASVALDTAYQLDPTQAHIQYLLGIAYDRQNQKDKAITFYTLALDNRYPSRTALRTRIALLLTDTQQFDLALKQYLALAEENAMATPDMYVTPIWLALDMQKDTETAWALASKAKAKFGDSPVSDNLLGWVALAQGRYAEAEGYLRESIAKKADYDAPWYNLGRVLEAKGGTEEAKNAYQRAYTVGGTSQIARLAAESYNRLSTLQP